MSQRYSCARPQASLICVGRSQQASCLPSTAAGAACGLQGQEGAGSLGEDAVEDERSQGRMPRYGGQCLAQGPGCPVAPGSKVQSERGWKAEAGLSGSLLLAVHALPSKEPTRRAWEDTTGRLSRQQLLGPCGRCRAAAVMRPELALGACLTRRFQRVPLPPCAAATRCWCR